MLPREFAFGSFLFLWVSFTFCRACGLCLALFAFLFVVVRVERAVFMLSFWIGALSVWKMEKEKMQCVTLCFSKAYAL